MKSQLPVPVSETLKPAMDEAQVQRMWSAIRARRTPPSVGHATLAWVAATVAVLVAVVTTGVVAWRGAPSHDAGALRRVGGGGVGTIVGAGGAVTLSDGSMITVAPGARLDELENDGHAVTFLLTHGRASFEVRPHGPRQWSIECGLATVTVVGTGFDVERDATSVHVRVRHGVVLVRGDRVPDRVQRLSMGEEITVREAPPTPAPNVIAAGSAPSVHEAPLARHTAAAPHAAAWHTLAERGAWQEAYGVLGAQGISERATDAQVDELLVLADIARLSGHPRDAVVPLERVLRDHGRSREAPLAAFTLGRIELDSLDEPARAAEAFAQAIALGAPPALLDDAFARLAEARQRAGDTAGARAAARDYLERFPQGRSVERMQPLAGEP